MCIHEIVYLKFIHEDGKHRLECATCGRTLYYSREMFEGNFEFSYSYFKGSFGYWKKKKKGIESWRVS